MVELNYTILIQMVIFIALVLTLNKLLYQPIFKIMDERQKVVEGSLEEAKRLSQETERMLSEYESKLIEARQKAVQVVNQAKIQAQEEQKEALTRARKEFEQSLAELRSRLEEEKQQAREKLRQMVNYLAILISEKILGRKLEERL
ncbi:F-type H+-transporting ATPase subunit b [Thermosulfidibacter takaii ABI70S6]|uniref:ATP synthase subunit b n=1 Tax=Thermosulfidibacter takaii (strain DSM 17441 / JCM 13301 / NBRC 103674 / ABI70S6) TaxID=1298851 RepID=A0A0S3QTK7_THET7|nr:F0F1 ATP synthase subunit B [Thermosulfidibacter takaii]BAT71673.1 F-type H+-transporting ATPase subunit b [Thermosulfidibacter takaii ABI70S6]